MSTVFRDGIPDHASLEHESVVALFRNRPSLAGEILRQVLGIPLPEYDKARVESGDPTEWNPAEYRADVVTIHESGVPVTALIVEVQRGRDLDKRWSWPAPTHELEDMMASGTYPYKSDFARRHFARGEGEAKGEAKAILRVLSARGVCVSDEVRERVTGCTDIVQLERWLDRAVVATSVDDVFRDG